VPKLSKNSGHGGARSGAGRPRKHDFWEMLTIGQDCETRWRGESKLAIEAGLSRLSHADNIRTLQEGAQAIPVSQRKAWLAGDGYDDHRGDIEAFLHDRAGTPFSDESGNYLGAAPRLVTVSAKPPRGTRKRIISEVATFSGLSESAVDNLWQAYRRFERELQESVET